MHPATFPVLKLRGRNKEEPDKNTDVSADLATIWPLTGRREFIPSFLMGY